MTSPSSARPSTNRRCDGTITDGCGAKPSTLRPSPSLCPEQQGPPQALPTLGRAVRHRRSTPSRCLQIGNHRRQGLHQCLEHQTATSFLPLNNAYSSLSVFVFTKPRSLVTTDPYKLRGVGPHSGADDINDTSTFTLQKLPVSHLQTFSKVFRPSHNKVLRTKISGAISDYN